LHVSEPHGYLGGDDPLDERFDVMTTTLNSVLIIIGLSFIAYLLIDGSFEKEKEVDKKMQTAY
jgi:hypothetical protein